MKKIFVLICLLLVFSCSEKSEHISKDDYKTYKSFVENSDWYKSILKKSGKNKIDFKKTNSKELSDPIDIIDGSNYEESMEKYYIYSPNKEYILDPNTYGLEIDPRTNEEMRDADRAVFLYDLKNNKSARILFIGPSGTIDLVSWINESSFFIITTDHENGEKNNINIKVYSIEDNKIYEINEFYSEIVIK